MLIGKNNELEGYSALHCAAQKNNISVLKFLLENSEIFVDCTTQNGTTPLLIALDDRNEAIVDLLVKHGANVNASYTRLGGICYTFLEFYLSGGFSNSLPKDNLKSAELLLTLNATITNRSIEGVIIDKDLDGIMLLKKYGATFTNNCLTLAKSKEEEVLRRIEKLLEQLVKLNNDRCTLDLNYLTRLHNECKNIRMIIESSLDRKLAEITIPEHKGNIDPSIEKQKLEPNIPDVIESFTNSRINHNPRAADKASFSNSSYSFANNIKKKNFEKSDKKAVAEEKLTAFLEKPISLVNVYSDTYYFWFSSEQSYETLLNDVALLANKGITVTANAPVPLQSNITLPAKLKFEGSLSDIAAKLDSVVPSTTASHIALSSV